MRHRRATRKLGRNSTNRKALMRSLASSLITHERISTTYEKAKEASIFADRLITLGKRNTSTSKKNVISILGSKLLINKLFDDVAPRFANRKGGYTRVLQLMPRKGDGASMAILELTERKIVEKPPDKEKGKKAKKVPSKVEEPPKPKKEKDKEPPKPEKEILAEEKSKEKAKSEKDKVKKGFFKGLRRYFRGKST